MCMLIFKRPHPLPLRGIVSLEFWQATEISEVKQPNPITPVLSVVRPLPACTLHNQSGFPNYCWQEWLMSKALLKIPFFLELDTLFPKHFRLSANILSALTLNCSNPKVVNTLSPKKLLLIIHKHWSDRLANGCLSTPSSALYREIGANDSCVWSIEGLSWQIPKLGFPVPQLAVRGDW